MYKSKYYTCEEVDERLLKGYYYDAVSNGYSDTFEQFKIELASIKDISVNKQAIAEEKAAIMGTDRIEDRAVTLHKLSEEIINYSKNRFNPSDSDVKVGYYLNQDGDLMPYNDYIVSGYIPFNKRDGSLICSIDGTANSGVGFCELYDSHKNRISGFISSEINGILRWQDRVAYARFSIFTGDNVRNIQIEQGETITDYEPYSSDNLIRESLIPIPRGFNPTKSLTGKEAESKNFASLVDSEKIELTDFPWHIKKGLVMSMYAKVTSFSALIIGKGYREYRGDYLRINETNIVQIRYESSEVIKETVTHGLTIQTFVKVSLTSDNLGRMYVVLQTEGGKFEYTFKNWAFEANYAPFAVSEGSTLTDVELSAGCQDFRLPVWAFGDSYFGVDSSRWIGVMKGLGYFNFLVNGLAGQSSPRAYADLERCLKFGTPKFLLWCLGMNDTDENFKTYFEKVNSICKSNDITLIAATVPTVPTRDKEVITQYVKDSGLRYIDFYKAVGTSPSGTWYSGYLNADGVHPNDIGAQALATQVLVDFPELMQYGLYTEKIIDEAIIRETNRAEKEEQGLGQRIDDMGDEMLRLETIVPNQIRTGYSDDGVCVDLYHDNNSLWTDTIYPATEEFAGVMSAEDKIKLRTLGERISLNVFAVEMDEDTGDLIAITEEDGNVTSSGMTDDGDIYADWEFD